MPYRSRTQFEQGMFTAVLLDENNIEVKRRAFPTEAEAIAYGVKELKDAQKPSYHFRLQVRQAWSKLRDGARKLLIKSRFNRDDVI